MAVTNLNITETSPQDWSYVSEGGATVVFSYVGTSHPQFDGTVLRLRKASIASPQLNLEQRDDRQMEDSMIAFQRKVITRLISPEFLPRLESVAVDKPWLERIATQFDQERPLERKEKNCIDLTRRRAVLATDLIGNEPLVVEIKPKWAFLPSPIHLSPASRAIKTRTCRFCLHSYFRSPRRETPCNYCPLDLFSGNESRITRAVRALWGAWVDSQGSANNLKIFSRGKLLRPTDQIPNDGLSSEWLQTHDGSVSSECFTRAVVSLLMKTPILHILSKLQRTLDVLDIEGLTRLWRQAQLELAQRQGDPSHLSPMGVNSPYSSVTEPCLEDWEDFLDTYLSSHDKMDHSAPVSANLQYYVLAYLLSATFKDCSIMLKLDHPRHDLLQQGVNAVTLIDLDPKSIDRIHKWEQLDKEIVKAYIQVEGRQCIDEWKNQ